MQKLRHRLFSQSITQPRTLLVLPHVLHPCIKIAQDSKDLLFPKNFDQSWHPSIDMVYYQKNEVATWNDAEHCETVNTTFKSVIQLDNGGQQAKACSLLSELITMCNAKNKELYDIAAQITHSYHYGNDGEGGMGHIGAMLGLNDQISPNELAIIAAQIYQAVINKDTQPYIQIETKLIESLTHQIEIYQAASEHYDEQFLAKIILCFVDILHYNAYLVKELPQYIDDFMRWISWTYSTYADPRWSPIALLFHYVFYYNQVNQRKNAIDTLEYLEKILFSLKFSSDKQLPEKSKYLLQGAYVYNKCQLADVGFSEKIDLLEYSKHLLSQALNNKHELLSELFSEPEHGVGVKQSHVASKPSLSNEKSDAKGSGESHINISYKLAAEAKEKIEAQLFKNPNIVSVGIIAEKDAFGNSTKNYAIEVGIISHEVYKRSIAQGKAIIPSKYTIQTSNNRDRKEVNIYVVETGPIIAHTTMSKY